MKILITFNKRNMIYKYAACSQRLYKLHSANLFYKRKGKSALDDFLLINFFPSTKLKDWESTDEQKTRNGKQNRKNLH